MKLVLSDTSHLTVGDNWNEVLRNWNRNRISWAKFQIFSFPIWFLIDRNWNFERSFRFLINRNWNSGKVPEFGFLIRFRSSSSGGSVCANIIDTKGCQKYKGISTYCDRRFTKMNSVSGFPKHVQNIIVSIYFWMIWKWAWTGFGPVWTCFDPHWTSFGPGSRLLWTVFGPDWTRFGPGLRFVFINLTKNVA